MIVGIFGAGAIGVYVGGRLAASGARVVLVGRPSVADEIARAGGARLTDYRGFEQTVALEVRTDASELAKCDVVIVTVKSADTVAAAETLAKVVAPESTVVSLQNGVRNASALREKLAGVKVLPAMVPFNVLRQEGARFHQGTGGALAFERSTATEELARACRDAGLEADTHEDLAPIQWGKLLVNLNNAINALAGVPIQAMLADRGYRRVVAACVEEADAIVRRAGMRPKLPIKVPLPVMLAALRAPDWVFAIAARAMPPIDPLARSSMWDDLERGRRTEIQALNGEVVALARRLATTAPVNAAIVSLIERAEGSRSPKMSANELARAVGLE
jgi:2-dehydropantoate 2-reductase